MKFCKKCSTEKPLSGFYADKARPDGFYPICKDCHQSYMRNRYSRPGIKRQRQAGYERAKLLPGFAEAAKKRSEKHYSSIKGRAMSLLRSAQRSPDGCTLTLDWITERIVRRVCPVTGIAFDLSHEHQRVSGRAKNPYAPSLDRINPKGSYSPANTRVVIWQYNMMKGELTDAELLVLCQYVVQQASRQAA